MLDRLIKIIDQPFARDPEKLTEALEKASSSFEFMNSWCVHFQPPRVDREVKDEELDACRQNEANWLMDVSLPPTAPALK